MIIMTLDTKKCMSELLLNDTFDSFSFIEGEITTFNKFTLNGYIQKDFFEEPPLEEYSSWKDLRDYCFSLIKGKRTPLDFKLIYSLNSSMTGELLSGSSFGFTADSVQGLYLNFRYDGTKLTCTTGTSLKFFTMDKTLEQAWDKEAMHLLDRAGIAYEVGV